MEKLLIQSKSYLSLGKPGIIIGNLIPAISAFFLGLHQPLNLSFFFLTFLAISLIIASACTFNNIIDQKKDELMLRTQKRVLPQKELSLQQAFSYAVVLFCLGTFIFLKLEIIASFLATVVGFFFYVFLYTFGKYRTHHATLLGAVSGAIPPVAGYFAANPCWNETVVLLFSLLFFWQMPHFLAISFYRMEEYEKAAFPILPLVKGKLRAKWETFFYAVAFFITLFFLVEHLHLSTFLKVSSLLITIGWIAISLYGFKAKDDRLWAKIVFRYSLVIIMMISVIIPC